MAGYPIVLDLSGKLIVIVGGGGVALRKVQGLLAGGATRVKVVSPSFHAEMPVDSSIIQRVNESYRSEHLAGASIVFAATDVSEVNDAIVRDARTIGALVCRADVDEANAGDFATPAMLREGELLITVSSGGSPALSALIRDKIHGVIDPKWSDMSIAMQQIRPAIRASLPPSLRRQAFHDLCSDDAFAQLAKDGFDGLASWLKKKYPQLNVPDLTDQGR